jgi:hypothetical protein
METLCVMRLGRRVRADLFGRQDGCVGHRQRQQHALQRLKRRQRLIRRRHGRRAARRGRLRQARPQDRVVRRQRAGGPHERG